MTDAICDDHRVIVPPDADRARLDSFLAQHSPHYSRSQLQRWIRDGCVTLDGASVKAKQTIRAGQTIVIRCPPTRPAAESLRATDIPLDILYEDEAIVVLNKPAGLVVHPGAGREGGTLVNALLGRYPGVASVGDQERPGIVHRLDRGTSGVMIVALTDQAHRHLSQQFEQRTTEKSYVALCYGVLPKEGRAAQPIGRHPTDRKRMSTRSRQGKTAVTLWRVREYFGKELSLVDVRIETGRTHQIRVHFAAQGHPLVGDPTYGGGKTLKRLPDAWQAIVAPLCRPALHARALSLVHPTTGQRMTWETPMPEDLASICDACRSMAHALD